MSPRRIDHHTLSAAERRLFDVIQRDLPDTWIVLHSLGLANHQRKPWAEIDFVLIGPPGVFCLEVKGGRIRREGGDWIFTDRHNVDHRRKEGPFDQVGSASAALRSHLLDRRPGLKTATFGFAVATPDVRFNVVGPDIDNALVYDAMDTTHSFTRFVDRVVARWAERLGGERDPLDKQSRLEIRDLLRRDFDLRPALDGILRNTTDELVRMTEQQIQIINGLSANPRILVNGTAGTGKTYLAVAEAARLADEGARVLLTCYSKRLAHHLETLTVLHPLVEVAHIHGLMARIVKEAGLEYRLPPAEPQDLFAVHYPELCLEALLTEEQPARYDAVVVDEAQDLLTEANTDVLDALLEGGWIRGTWRLFYDPNQDVFSGTAPGGMRRILDAQPTMYRLTTNCRNTTPIAMSTSMLTGVECDHTMTVDGPEVNVQWYRDRAHQTRLLKKAVNGALVGGIRPDDIVILSRFSLDRSALGDHLHEFSKPIRDIDSRDGADGSIAFCTIAGFKGLEAPVAFVADIDDLTSLEAAALLYVSMSRARVMLSVFLDERLRSDYAELAMRFGERAAQPAAADS